MHFSHCTLEIDLSKIRKNYQILAQMCTPAKVGAAVKANAYGLGANKIAPILLEEGCRDFFVARIEEGIELRKVIENANIFVLNGVFYDDAEDFAEHNLIPALNHLGQVEIWQKFIKDKRKNLAYALHINTGMHRLGMPLPELEQLLHNHDFLKTSPPCLVMSHLSASEDSKNLHNAEQLAKFKKYLSFFPGIKASLANSSGIFLGKEYRFDLARAGVALYGANPCPSKPNLMHNPVTLTAPIIQLQELSSGATIGYNMTFTTNCDTIIATLPLGYGDGYSRHFSNCGEVFIGGFAAKVVGKVSMDLITVDVTGIPKEKIYLGAPVEIIGEHCTPDKIASLCGTIGYEILTKLGNRYKRIYS